MMRRKNGKLDRIIRKAYDEGIDELTPNEIKYVENRFINDLKNSSSNVNLRDIITIYHTNNNNLAKIIYFSNYLFKNDDERACEFMFGHYSSEHETEADIRKYEKLDYPFVHYDLAEFYHIYHNDLNKSLKHYARGAEQGSFFCASCLFDYYTCGTFHPIGKRPSIKDYEKALYYADICTETKKSSFNLDTYCLFDQLEESKNLTQEEKDKYYNIIMNSRGLLFEKSMYYYTKYKNTKDKSYLDLFLYYCTLSAEKGYFDANRSLGLTYSNQDNDVTDYKKAFYYCSKAYEISPSTDIIYYVINVVNDIVDNNYDLDILKNCSPELLAIVANHFSSGVGGMRKATLCYKMAYQISDVNEVKDSKKRRK